MFAAVLNAQGGVLPTPQAQPPHIEFKYYGFYSVVDYTMMMCLNTKHGDYVDDFMLNGVTAAVGWQWRKESGVGVGFSYLNDFDGAFSQIPIFVEFRSHYTRNRLTPFTVIQLGYTVPFGSQNSTQNYTKIDKGGITMGLSGGIRFAFKPKVGMNLYVGYQMLQSKLVERGDEIAQATKLPELYHCFKAGLGINF